MSTRTQEIMERMIGHIEMQLTLMADLQLRSAARGDAESVAFIRSGRPLALALIESCRTVARLNVGPDSPAGQEHDRAHVAWREYAERFVARFGR